MFTMNYLQKGDSILGDDFEFCQNLVEVHFASLNLERDVFNVAPSQQKVVQRIFIQFNWQGR